MKVKKAFRKMQSMAEYEITWLDDNIVDEDGAIVPQRIVVTGTYGQARLSYFNIVGRAGITDVALGKVKTTEIQLPLKEVGPVKERIVEVREKPIRKAKTKFNAEEEEIYRENQITNTANLRCEENF